MCIFHIINKLNREGDLLLREPLKIEASTAFILEVQMINNLCFDANLS